MDGTLKDLLIDRIRTLPEADVEAVLEYVRFLQSPEDDEGTEAEARAIEKGRAEFSAGEFVRWKDIRTDAL